MNMTPSAARARLLELAKTNAAPLVLRSGAPKASDVDSAEYEVRSNRLWAARWAGATILLLALREPSNPRTVVVAPVTIEPGLEDQESVVLDASTNELGLPMTVWLGLTREIPIRTLERPLGEVLADIPGSPGTIADMTDVTGQSAGTRPGHGNYGDTSPSAEKRSEMEDLLDQWMEDLEPLSSEVEKAGTDHEKPSFTLTQVMEALDVPQRQATNIIRGRQELLAEEIQQLAAHVGSTPDAISAVAEPLPSDLLLELEQPRWRHLVRTEAQSGKTDEADARHNVARQAFALAARQHGEGRNVWRQRLRTIALGRLRESTNPEE